MSSGRHRAKKNKKRVGAKSKLTLDRVDKALALAKKGVFDATIAQVIGVHPSTFCEWKGSYSEFSEALKEAREKPVEAVEAALFRSAMGYTHMEEKVFVNKNGKVTRVKVEKHYAPNSAAMSLYLRSLKPDRYRESLQIIPPPAAPLTSELKTFEKFCTDAGYPAPYPKQVEMMKFGLSGNDAHLLLGARNYGKTDYVVILGVAYAIYVDFFTCLWNAKLKQDGKEVDGPLVPSDTTLLVTKSEERNAAILTEIQKAAEANGVTFEKATASHIRVTGLHGKDHSVASVTIGTSSIRGRHPKRNIMDDPVTEEDTSEATRKRVQKVYNELNKLCSNILVIGQPVHKFDLFETVRPLLRKMEVPHGTIPELDHDLEAQRLAGVSEESISASYHLKVISESGMPLEKVQPKDDFTPGGDAVAFIDPSFEGGDYTALTILKGYFDGVEVKGHCYKRAWYDCVDEMYKAMQACGVKRLCIETNSLGDQPVIVLRDALNGIGVTGKKSTGHKHSRILMAGAYAKQIHIAKTSDRIYIDQIRKYEYGAGHDDAPDSLASCLEWVGLIRGKTKT